MQAVTRNPLASPGIMGLNTGASFATLLVMVLLPTAGRPELMLVSIGGAALGAALVYGLGSLSRDGLTPVRLALTGIAVSALLGAIGNGVMIYNELGQDLLLWHARGTEGVQWLDIGLFSPLAGVGLLGALAIAPTLSILTLGDHVARGLGQRTRLAKFLAAAIVLVLAGGAVSLAGPVGFHWSDGSACRAASCRLGPPAGDSRLGAVRIAVDARRPTWLLDWRLRHSRLRFL